MSASDERDEEALATAPPALRALLAQHPQARSLIARILATVSAVDADPVARWRTVFDRAAALSPEAAVALYSLGDPARLDAMSQDIVNRLADYGLLHPDQRVLDLGCGIGRMAGALTGRVGLVLGLDVSEAMLREAQRRAGQAGVFARTSGRDLGALRSGSVDLVLALDSLPYIVAAGLTEGMLADIRRVLRPEGAFVAFNWSYRGDIAADIAEAAHCASRYGFTLRVAGEGGLATWDGRAFVLTRSDAQPA